MRVVQRSHLSGVPSKLNPKYAGLCEVLKIRGPVLTLRELGSLKVLTANHDAVRSSSLLQPDAQLPAVPANLRLFDMSLSRPEAENRDFPDAEVPYNIEIDDNGDPVIQSMNLSLPDARFNFVVSSLLDLQCSPPPAVLPQSRSLRVCPTRRPRALTPQYTSTQAEIPSLQSIPASSPSAPISDAADRPGVSCASSYPEKTDAAPECLEETAKHRSRLSLQGPETGRSNRGSALIAVAVQQFGTGKSNHGPAVIAVVVQQSGTGRSNRGPAIIAVVVQQSRTGRLNRGPVAIAVAQQLSKARSSIQMPIVMAVAPKIRKLIASLNSKSRESLRRRAIYRNRSAYRSAA